MTKPAMMDEDPSAATPTTGDQPFVVGLMVRGYGSSPTEAQNVAMQIRGHMESVVRAYPCLEILTSTMELEGEDERPERTDP